MKNKLKLTKYGSVSYGVKEHERGTLLKVDEVYQALDYVLDDDELVRDRIVELKSNLE